MNSKNERKSKKNEIVKFKRRGIGFSTTQLSKKREVLKKKLRKEVKEKWRDTVLDKLKKHREDWRWQCKVTDLFFSQFFFLFSVWAFPPDPHVPSFLNSWDTRAAVSHACPMSSTCQTWVWHLKCCVYASQLSTKQAKRSGYKSFKGRWPHHWSYQNRTQAPSPTSKVTSALR